MIEQQKMKNWKTLSRKGAVWIHGSELCKLYHDLNSPRTPAHVSKNQKFLQPLDRAGESFVDRNCQNPVGTTTVFGSTSAL